MADIASSDVVYSQVVGSAKAGPSSPQVSAQFNVTFGDGALTYPAGGIPLLKGKLGCPTVLEELVMIEADADDGFLYKFDKSAETLRIFQTAAVADTDPAAPLVELVAATATPAATTLIVKVSGY